MGLIPELKKFYAQHRRDLPWRRTRDPYRILVSEIMLQQTQVDRVLPKYEAFLRRFPDASALAAAPFSAVLKEWSGLGYNRRAKYLHESAKIIIQQGFGGKLPGVGPYTRAAVEAFAHNIPGVFIETNIRTVFIHFYFPGEKQVADAELFPYIKRALARSGMEPRDFYAALMDYGAYLKKQGLRLNPKSKHYNKQKRFEGSVRQLRGRLLCLLLDGPASARELAGTIRRVHGASYRHAEVRDTLSQLVRDGLVVARGARFEVAR